MQRNHPYDSTAFTSIFIRDSMKPIPRFIAIVATIVLFSGCSTTPRDKLSEQIVRYREGAPISVSAITIYGPDAAGGIPITLYFVNPSRTVYKYVRMKFSATNRVGDRVYSEIGNEAFATIEAVGPIGYGEGSDRYGNRYKPLWYNSTVHCVILESVELVKMDNSILSFDKNQVKDLVPRDSTSFCRNDRVYFR